MRFPPNRSYFALPAGTTRRMNIRRYLLVHEVIERIRLSRSTIYRQIAAGSFPAPYSLSENRAGWLESEIDNWCRTRERRTQGEAPRGPS